MVIKKGIELGGVWEEQRNPQRFWRRFIGTETSVDLHLKREL